MLTVCASATSEALTSLAYVKSLLDLHDNEGDGLLTQLIGVASERVQRHCRQSFLRQRYSETVAGYGSRRLTVSRTPIRAVYGLFNGTDTGLDAEILSTDYRVEDAEAGLLRTRKDFLWTAGTVVDMDETPIPGSEAQSYLVRYEAGYIGPLGATSTAFGTTSTGRTLPYDIEQAAAELTKQYYLGRQRDGMVKSKSVGDLSITYADAPTDGGAMMPGHVRALLGPYVRMGG